MENFTSNTISLQEESIPKALDYVFSNLDDRLINGHYSIVDSILGDIDIEKVNPVVLVGILTITDPWKGILKKRGELYNKVVGVVNSKYTKKESIELLYNLK